MASPFPSAPMGNWGGNGQAVPPPPFTGPVESGDGGVIIKTMGLKVTYAFADSGESFLARYPELLTVRTVTIDDKLTVGMVDLQMCVRAVVKCSPELLSNATRDFAVYAYDYSEPDEPLVGQGLLGWIVNNSDGKQIIGRATRNPLSAFSNGIKEILEIKLKLKPVAAMAQPHYEPEPRPDLRHSYQRSESHTSVEIQPARPAEGALTPSSHAEWNSFMQANPQMSNQPHPQTAALPHQPSMHPDSQHHQYLQRSNSFTYSAPQPLPPTQQQQHHQQNQPQHPQPQPQPQPQPPMQNSDGPNRVAPTPVDTATETQVNPPSRPSSRASNTSRKSRATGRPRGRPRKQPRAESQGNTSGYEDGTDGDDGPAKKKRATVMTQVTSNINAPFGGGPESLRVTASTAGSLRTLRPMGISVEAPMGSHMQDVPRAPTPVPERGPMMPQTGKPTNSSKLRRQSTLSQAATPPGQPQYPEPPFALSPSQQDGRSPDSDAVSPAYSDDSPAAIGSSPPVPRNTRFVRSSPPASSPILPPMPMPQPDSGFMSGGVDDVFEADGARLQLPKPVVLPSARRSNSNSTKKRSAQPPQIPVYTFHLATQPSSEMDSAPNNNNNNNKQVTSRPPTSTLPLESSLPPQHAASDSTVTLPPPPQPAEKEPSPQQQEHVVAANPDVQTDSQIAPKIEAGLPGEYLDMGLEKLAQAVRNMSPETVLPDPRMDPAVSATFARPSAPPSLSRSNSSGFSLALPSVPASDPIGPVALPAPALPQATSFSEAPCPPSDALQPPRSPPQPSKSNKNYVKKQAIREKLLQAIASGQTPMYCSNCGAIETPTWRKIWSQEHEGVPEFTEFSDKPGRITAILVLDRDADEKPIRYQIIKKTLSPHEDKADWKDHMLCNPCGIWLTKWKSHRPQDKWEKDGARLGQQRRARGTGRAPRPPKTKKSGSANPLNPTSEAYFTTDPIGPDDRGASPMDESRSRGVSQFSNVNDASQRSMSQFSASQPPEYYGSQPTSPGNVSNPGSTHSRGSGTAKSPITIDNTDVQGMGATRRLLFPSPRKGGVSKALGELAVNVVQTVLEPNPPVVAAQNKEVTIKEHGHGATPSGGSGANKENLAVPEDDALEDLFRSPGLARPSTPPPREPAANNGPFKTPTRPTPSHRPITRSVTRSVSRSLRSGDLLRSPAAVRRTPTRTPRSAKNPIRRSPRLHHDEFAQMELALEEYLQTQPVDHQYDSDMLEAMNRALAESVNSAGSNFDITNMVLDSNCQLEFGDLLGPPSRPTPRPARQQANDYEDWDTWENNVRTRQTADNTKNQ